MDTILENNNIQNPGAINKYAQVIIDIPNLDTRTFSYLIPDDFKEVIDIGQPVLVPFGTQGTVNAFVVGFSNYLPENIKAKSIYEILSLEPIFDIEYLKLLEWVSEYYCSTLPTVLATALPMNFIAKSKRVVSITNNPYETIKLKVNDKKIIEFLTQNNQTSVSNLQRKIKLPPSKFYESIRKLRKENIIEIKNIIEEKSQKTQYEKYITVLNKDNVTKRQLEVLDKLGIDELKLTEALTLTKTTRPTINKLVENKNIKIVEKEVYRNPLKIFETEEKDTFPELNFEQKIAADKIAEAIDKQDSEPFLLYGITGSGKTEVYFDAIKKTIEAGKNVIFLAPEIPIASQLAQRLTRRFGVDDVAIWHSSIAEGEKFDVWRKLQQNKIKIICGARSAIFAPIKNLGLIIIDEEHESSYKQTSPTPRYNAKKVAEQRAKRTNSTIVLGSATPDIYTYYKALNRNKILALPQRFGCSELAKTNIVDMKHELNSGNKSLFSRALKNAINKNIEDKKQTIILINRRGYSTSSFCQGCGHVLECKKCAIPLIRHKTSNNLRCHYCNYEQAMVNTCPECGSDAIKYYGMGTQRVEEAVLREFPQAKVARVDSDILTKKNAHIELINEFSKGEIDILIGTQMIAKGLDNPNVTLVGVLMADSSFNLPDFKASERGFQLLTQVAGRAGRGEAKGRVYFQTYQPEFFAIKDAKAQSYESFYNQELKNRYELAYPPYSQVIRLILSSKNEYRTEKFSMETAMRLKELTKNKGIDERLEVLGPAKCIIGRIKEEFRFQIIIKNRLEEQGHFLITNFVKKMSIPQDIKFLIDVDPSDML